ncbi:MAG TPA: M48 family metalloprotease [Candidatus Angelobacter sp.]|nr:M48 family metalloprotease [Candidatus Angelobacter sp.]
MTGKFKSQTQSNLFSEQQEEWLGDIMDQSIRGDFRIIEDPEGYLQKLGESLLAQLPPTSIHYRFVIIDSPELNSFGVAGGRIYIHRRMVAFAQNQDEFAAVLGHEIGHIMDHHVAISMSDWLKQLGVTSIGDRQDVFAKWNLVQDNAGKIKVRSAEKTEQEEQLIADRIALYAASRAGYAPARYVEFADRLLETKHNKGGFWSDFLGTTKPESKRLREVIKNSAPLEKNCVVPPIADQEHYLKWQKSIIESHAAVSRQELPGLLKQVELHPQLRSDLGNLQFSPDGTYLLAQDESNIFVLSREPLANLFRIDAPDAHHAHFSPDSHTVVFYDKELRVEKWDVASRQRTSIHQLTIQDCLQSVLSPSGDMLGCIDYELNLRLADVNDNKVILERKHFYELTRREYYAYERAFFAGEPLRLFDMKFSPDGRYFAAGHNEANFVYDFQAKAEIHLPNKTKALMVGTFAFISGDEIAGIHFAGKNSKLIRAHFPSGDRTDEFDFQVDGWLSNTANRDYLLVRPAGKFMTGIVDLKEKKISYGFKTPAFDVYGNILAGEQTNGQLALFNAAEKKMAGKIQLPDSPLANFRVSAFSPGGEWLAVSSKSRGAVWKVDTGERTLLTTGFEGAFFENGQFITKFPSQDAKPSWVARFDPASAEPTRLYELPEDPEHPHGHSFQAGDLMIELRPEKDKDPLSVIFGPFVMEVHDVHNGNPRWQYSLQDRRPGVFYNGRVIAVSLSGRLSIQTAAKDDPVLRKKLNSMDAKHSLFLLQVLDANDGKHLGNVVVDTGKDTYLITSAYVLGDTVFLGDSTGRTLIYSLGSGEQKGKILGHVVTASANGKLALIASEDKNAELYDTTTLQPLTHFVFPESIAGATFLANGNLMVLTANQNVYQLDITGAQAASVGN